MDRPIIVPGGQRRKTLCKWISTYIAFSDECYLAFAFAEGLVEGEADAEAFPAV